MGVQTLEHVNVLTPYWTSFPALVISGVDWDDHHEAHKAIMGMFARDLPGPAAQRRAVNGILFRRDLLNGVPTILVQSSIPPELVPVQARSMSVPQEAWALGEGTPVGFRLAVNPVRRFRGATRVVSDEELPGWLEERTGGALTDVTFVNTVRGVTRSSHGQKMLTVTTIDAVGRVADADRFCALRRHGVGRSKSYGAGLLTARAIG